MRFNIGLVWPDTHALRPIIPDNAWGLCITAAAGTELATPYSRGTISPPNGGFSHAKAVYNPKAFFLHAASLDQAFAHCRIFSATATRRCTNRLSVSSLGNTLSRPLPVIALVSRYLTNKLIGPRPLPKRLATLLLRDYRELVRLSADYARLWGTYQGITNSFAGCFRIATKTPLTCMPYPRRQRSS